MTSQELKQLTEADKSVSFWLKKAIVTAEGRDVLDALDDAQTLLVYCQARAKEAGLRVSMTNQKQISGKPIALTVDQLMFAAAEGDAAAINILHMIDDREIGKYDAKRIAEVYNATQL